MTGFECTAANGRFGASGAVTPQTILCGFARLSPAGTTVEAPPAPSRWVVGGKFLPIFSGDFDSA